jgi:hypothetical protein
MHQSNNPTIILVDDHFNNRMHKRYSYNSMASSNSAHAIALAAYNVHVTEKLISYTSPLSCHLLMSSAIGLAGWTIRLDNWMNKLL